MVLAVPVEVEEMHAQIGIFAVKVEFALAEIEVFHLAYATQTTVSDEARVGG